MNYSVSFRDGFTLVCSMICILARKPHPRSISARPAMLFVKQEGLVLKFLNLRMSTAGAHVL